MSANDLYHDLIGLTAERARAVLEHPDDPETPLVSEVLAEEIEDVRNYFIGAAVTEIATLRGELWGRLEG